MIEQMVHPHNGILYSSIIYNEGYLPVKTHKKEVSQILNIVWVQLGIIEGNIHIHKNRKEMHQEVNSGYIWVVEL